MEEHRRESRVPHNIRFFVHIHDCKEQPEMVGESVACEAVDFSPHGLQFRTEQALVPGSILNITVGVGEPYEMYLLRGEIRWVRNNAGAHSMGVLLRFHEGTDYTRWENEFNTIFSRR